MNYLIQTSNSLRLIWLLGLSLSTVFSLSAQKANNLSNEEQVNAILKRANYNITRNTKLAQCQLDSTAVLIKNKSGISVATHANAHVTQGNLYKYVAKYDLAQQNYLEGIKLYEKIQDNAEIAKVNVNIAALFMELKQFEKAKEVALKAIALQRQLKQNKNLSKSLSLLAGIYFNTDQADKVLPTLSEAIQCAKDANAQDQLVALYTNKIQTFFKFKQPEKAAEDIDALEALSIKIDNKRGLANAQFYKGYVAKTQGKYAEANTYYEQSAVYFENNHDFYRLLDIYEAISINSYLMGDYKKACDIKSSVVALTDSTFSERQQKMMNEMSVKYETEKKEAQLQQQRSALELASLREKQAQLEAIESAQAMKATEWELSNSEARNRQAQLEAERDEAQIAMQQDLINSAKQRQTLLLIGFAIFAVLLGLLLWQFAAARRANKELAKSNNRIELMMRELHHRVKNNLQMVSSLFRLQARRMADENTATVLREGQARVEAMSILHQQLYQNEAVTDINLQVYLEALVDKLQYAFGFSNRPFSYTLNVEPSNIDVDKALPIGLIVNELLTNSFKYAFANVEQPKIHLEIRPNYLHYSDNGVGLPANFNPQQVNSFGMRLITSFSQQLNGKYEFWNETGLNFKLNWKL